MLGTGTANWWASLWLFCHFLSHFGSSRGTGNQTLDRGMKKWVFFNCANAAGQINSIGLLIWNFWQKSKQPAIKSWPQWPFLLPCLFNYSENNFVDWNCKLQHERFCWQNRKCGLFQVYNFIWWFLTCSTDI